MNQKPFRFDTCVVIPRAGLGDVMYACLALKLLMAKGVIRRGVVFAPSANREVVRIFQLEHIVSYSKLLQPGRIAFSLKDEWRFFKELRRFKGCAGLSVLNDTIDALLYQIGGLVRLPVWHIGNYFRAFDDGMRSKLNRYLSPSSGADVPNPRHVMARYLHLLNKLAPCTLDELWHLDWATIEEARTPDQTAQDKETIVVIPDAAVLDKELSVEETIKLVRAMEKHGRVVVFSQRPNIRDSEIGPLVTNYRSMMGMLWLLRDCRLLVCSDTFGGHLGGMARARMVVLDKIVRKWESHWEFWGLPHPKALHVSRGRTHRLLPDFTSEEIPLQACNIDVQDAVRVVYPVETRLQAEVQQ